MGAAENKQLIQTTFAEVAKGNGKISVQSRNDALFTGGVANEDYGNKQGLTNSRQSNQGRPQTFLTPCAAQTQTSPAQCGASEFLPLPR